MLTVFIKKGQFTKEEETVLNVAVENENAEIVKLLLTNDKIDVNFLHKENKNNYFCKFWIQQKGKAPLHAAVEKGNIEIVKVLLTNTKLDINLPYKFLINKKLLKKLDLIRLHYILLPPWV